MRNLSVWMLLCELFHPITFFFLLDFSTANFMESQNVSVRHHAIKVSQVEVKLDLNLNLQLAPVLEGHVTKLYLIFYYNLDCIFFNMNSYYLLIINIKR
jgi:hypothetical protein